MLNTYSTTVSQVFCCGECHSPVVLGMISPDDFGYTCCNAACGKAVHENCAEALAIIADVALTVAQPAQAEPLPPIEVLASVAADLVLAAADAGDTAQVNSLNKAAQYLHDGVRATPSAGGFLVPSGTRGGVIHRITRQGCTCEAGRSGKATCWHRSLVDIVGDARARLVVLAYRQRIAA